MDLDTFLTTLYVGLTWYGFFAPQRHSLGNSE